MTQVRPTAQRPAKILKVNRSDIHFPPKHEPLREDVHALGALMGEILREQGGEQLFELVELDRVAAIRGRAGSREARAELAACVRERPPALAREVVRAFSIWFQTSTWRKESTGSGAAASICSRTVSAPTRRRGGLRSPRSRARG